MEKRWLTAHQTLVIRLGRVNSKMANNLFLADIPIDDEPTWRLFRAGDTEGIFQFGVPAMKEYLIALQPDSLDDLETLFALFTPKQWEEISVFIQYKKLGLPYYFDKRFITVTRLNFIKEHTIIAWKQAYLKANYGVWN
ncbi:MAG: hypothetical protein JST58_05040 [Bacteroidetes bacterium]|nr:hypothetical protein [Bacteroidota bacterium]